jgi:general secretion pathway protein A
MGDLFGVELRPHNRWGGFRALLERWLGHLDSTLPRPVRVIDDAQEMPPTVLNKLRLFRRVQKLYDSQSRRISP